MVVLPFCAMRLVVVKGLFIPIAVDFYAFHLAFSSILHCICQQNALHFAPKRTAFCTKLHCVLHQIALQLAAYCPIFSSKHP